MLVPVVIRKEQEDVDDILGGGWTKTEVIDGFRSFHPWLVGFALILSYFH